jgi:RNA ligase (TIGR02306 family)
MARSWPIWSKPAHARPRCARAALCGHAVADGPRTWATTNAQVRRRDTVLGTHSAIRGHDVEAAAKQLADELDADRVGIFGEVYGEGVQDLHYGDSAKAGVPGYAVFDVKVAVGGDEHWLSQDEMVDVLASIVTLLPTVPRLYEGPCDVDC